MNTDDFRILVKEDANPNRIRFWAVVQDLINGHLRLYYGSLANLDVPQIAKCPARARGRKYRISNDPAVNLKPLLEKEMNREILIKTKINF